MSRLAHNLSANFLSNAWSTAIALLLTPLYVKWLGIESYALIGFYASWVAILGILDTGVSATAMRQLSWMSALPAERPGIPSFVRTLEVTYWAGVLLFGAAMLAAASWFGPTLFHAGDLTPGQVRDALMLMAVSLVMQVPSGLYIGGLIGLQRQVESSALVATFATLRAAGSIAVLWFVRPDIRVFFMWQIAASVVQTTIIRLTLWRHIAGERPRFHLPLLRSVQRFAGGMTAVTALSVIIAQADKLILPRIVSLEAFGFYMLAWTVASGLSRVATPLIQAFAPRFTELTAKGDSRALAADVRTASRLMSAILLPPAALLVVLPQHILLAWIANPAVAASAAPLLSILAVGTVLSTSSFPALSVLYGQSRLRPVLLVSIISVVVLVPAVALAAIRFGTIGAACCWLVYGLVMYLAYQVVALAGLPGTHVFTEVIQGFLFPCAVSLAVAIGVRQLSGYAEGRLAFITLIAAGLAVGWAATFIACTDVLSRRGGLGWRPAGSL